MEEIIGALQVYGDSIEIAKALREMAEGQAEEDRYWLFEAADHIEGMYQALVSAAISDKSTNPHQSPDGKISFKPEWA